jgi:hypothetical protein
VVLEETDRFVHIKPLEDARLRGRPLKKGQVRMVAKSDVVVE